MKDRQPHDISPYDTAEFPRSPAEISDYLEAVFENYGDDHRMIIKALGTVARAQGMQKIADKTGLQRQGLYKSLSDEGNPSFETVLKVMSAVGVELRPKKVFRRRRREPVIQDAGTRWAIERKGAAGRIVKAMRKTSSRNQSGR